MVFAVWVGDLSVLSIWSRAAPSSWVATQTERVGDPNGVIRDPTKNKKEKKKQRKRVRLKGEKLSNRLSKSGLVDYRAAPYEGPVGTQQRQNMKKRARLKVEKLSNKIPKSGPVDY